MSALRGILLPGLGVVVIAAAVASEFFIRRADPPGRVRITYWEKWTGFEYEGIKATVDDFNRSQDRIFVELLTVSNLSDKALLAISAGVPPDVAGLWGPAVASYADNRAVEPLDDYLKQAGITRDYYIPVYWDIASYKGNIWCLPSTPASTALHYNRQIFRSAGLDAAQPPRTIEELTDWADRLTKKNGSRIEQAGFLPSEPGWWNWGWGYFFGGRIWDGKRRLTMNDEGYVRAYDWIQGFSKRYGPSEVRTFQSGFGNFSSAQNPFMSETVAMVLQGVWMHNFISMYNKGLDWAAAPFPHPADRPDLANITFADMDTLVIPRGAKHPDEAFDFIRYVQSQKAMEKLCLSHQKNSPLHAISDDFWNRHGNPYIRLFDKLARSPNAVPPPKIGMWPQISQEMSVAFEETSLLQKTPKQALDRVVMRMQPLLDEYLRRLDLQEAKP
jgi:ABC-type glycerol-3-phosphate transport system substrate-binding protein